MKHVIPVSKIPSLAYVIRSTAPGWQQLLDVLTKGKLFPTILT